MICMLMEILLWLFFDKLRPSLTSKLHRQILYPPAKLFTHWFREISEFLFYIWGYDGKFDCGSRHSKINIFFCNACVRNSRHIFFVRCFAVFLLLNEITYVTGFYGMLTFFDLEIRNVVLWIPYTDHLFIGASIEEIL